MSHVFILVVSAFFLLGICFKGKNKVTVKGTVTFTQAYCGGAAPSQKLLDDLRTPRPLSGKKIYLRKGKMNQPSGPIVAEAITDEDGHFTFHLPNGSYYIVSDDKKDLTRYNQILETFSKTSDNYSAVDKSCLDKWINTPDLLFEVKDKDTTIHVSYFIPCSWNSTPCVNYTGVLPP